jgi:LuxR family maltose regulon positive regulatory protein
VRALAAGVDTMRSGAIGASSLTAAELRLVPYLPTHLTFPQIAARLIVSRNTVKSQAISVYQKLGVSSRADAVARLQELGLLAA